MLCLQLLGCFEIEICPLCVIFKVLVILLQGWEILNGKEWFLSFYILNTIFGISLNKFVSSAILNMAARIVSLEIVFKNLF